MTVATRHQKFYFATKKAQAIKFYFTENKTYAIHSNVFDKNMSTYNYKPKFRCLMLQKVKEFVNFLLFDDFHETTEDEELRLKKRDEDGHYVTKRGAHMKGHPIPTIGKSLDEIQEGVKKFIKEAKAHPENRYLVHKVGYHKTGYTLQQIAPMFKDAVGMKNVLMREDMLNELLKESE